MNQTAISKDNVGFNTFDIQEAASFLGAHKETVRRLAASGVLPAVKIGRAWRFIEQDLVMYMRSNYTKRDISQGVHTRGTKTWHSQKEVISIGLDLHTMEKEYKKALGLITS
jgi:excisionase family DNA binding protein